MGQNRYQLQLADVTIYTTLQADNTADHLIINMGIAGRLHDHALITIADL